MNDFPDASKFAMGGSAAKTKTLGQLATPDTKSSNGVLSPRLTCAENSLFLAEYRV